LLCSRVSGVLLHPTSLPGGAGIGDMGPGARRFVDFLASAGQRRWQVLPLGPTGFGDSPYACLSTHAGNPLLVSPEQLLADGYLRPEDLPEAPGGDLSRVDFGAVIAHRETLFERAWQHFCAAPPDGAVDAYRQFCKSESSWLDDYALYAALKIHHGGGPWPAWDAPLRDRDPAALERSRVALSESIDTLRFRQFLFFGQWQALRRYANEHQVQIIGDLPIYVPHDSADVWANRTLFELDSNGSPTVVAGVPPDYFSATGQLWGNPVYRWPTHAESGYVWWIERLRNQLRMVDVLRLDHFRGFAAYWEVPGDSEVATHGIWKDGPGRALFDAVAEALGSLDGLPLIAEDLGIITDDVVALRRALNLPGMAVLQFAFDSDTHNLHLPHRHHSDQVVYTGTHDNDTTLGWYAGVSGPVRSFATAYLNTEGESICRDLIRLALGSVAGTAVIPMQDVLALGPEARMNRPGSAGGNWSWRMTQEQLDAAPADEMLTLTHLFGRI